MQNRSDIIARVCNAVSVGAMDAAAAILANDYPFTPLENVGRRYTATQCTMIFVRDGFIDRYSGQRLVFPGALRLLSKLLPAEFPFQPNWKTDACHFAFYELFPTVDHILPVSRGGADAEPNWVSTSMIRNAAKANFTIEELGWSLLPPGNLHEWDGGIRWFAGEYAKRPEMHGDAYLKRWADAARRTLMAV